MKYLKIIVMNLFYKLHFLVHMLSRRFKMFRKAPIPCRIYHIELEVHQKHTCPCKFKPVKFM